MAGNLKANVIQLGDSVTATNNFVWQTNVDGTAKLARGNAGATTQDVLTVDATGKLTLSVTPAMPAQSMVRLNTANGYGSTNTKIRRFSTVLTQQGADITYADSATLGATFTVNTNGVYAIAYNDVFNAAAWMGVSVNTTQTTAMVQVLAAAEIVSTAIAIQADYGTGTSSTLYLAAGSVIRAHTGGVASGNNAVTCQFTIVRVA